MSAKPLLVGEANPYGADPAMALYPLPPHASGGRLRQILGLSLTEYLRKFDRANLCPSTWDRTTARKRATELLAGPHATLVLLGAKVCAAFGLKHAPFKHLHNYRLGYSSAPKNIVMLPHPSGLSRAWNEQDAVQRARDALRDAGVDLSPVYCQAARDGECQYAHCTQLRDGESARTGRGCPAKHHEDEEE